MMATLPTMEIIKQEESVKITKGMTGKMGYEFKLLGKPEDNLNRIKGLKEELNEIVKEDVQ